MITLTLRNACFIFRFATALPVEAATVTYTGLPYRGRFDSPFYQSIQNGATYVEDLVGRMDPGQPSEDCNPRLNAVTPFAGSSRPCPVGGGSCRDGLTTASCLTP